MSALELLWDHRFLAHKIGHNEAFGACVDLSNSLRNLTSCRISPAKCVFNSISILGNLFDLTSNEQFF